MVIKTWAFNKNVPHCHNNLATLAEKIVYENEGVRGRNLSLIYDDPQTN